jgi:hypothetical protein
MIVAKNPNPNEEFVVVHPLFDGPEAKLDGAGLGQMQMTPTVRFFLILLRVYLVGVGLILVYHLLDLAGVIHHFKS